MFVPASKGVQLWAAWINDNGGLNGHPVHLEVFDDQSDPSTNKAQVEQAVEHDHALAILGEYAPQGGQGSLDYINRNHIPVVGGLVGDPWFGSSPMYFSTGPAGSNSPYSSVAAAASVLAPAGKTKVGIIVCAEATSCANLESGYSSDAGKVGPTVVYRATASLAQPDYTAECLNARSAGAQALLLAFDTNSVRRIVASCSRQGYHPVVQGGDDTTVADPAFEGEIMPSEIFPWFQTSAPELAQFESAVARYAPGAVMSDFLLDGWVSGKLLERAARALPDQPTRTDLLQGLWAITNDTLGGLTQPLNFPQGKPSTQRACWWVGVVHNRAVQVLNGGKISCAG